MMRGGWTSRSPRAQHREELVRGDLERHRLEGGNGLVPRAPLLADGAHLDVGGGHGPHPIPAGGQLRGPLSVEGRARRGW